MKGLIINAIARLAGLGGLLKTVMKSKGYLAGASLILLALGGELGNVVELMQDGLSAAELLEYVKEFTTSKNFKMFLEGLGILGIRHAQEKATGV